VKNDDNLFMIVRITLYYCLFVAFSVVVFNACSGAASKRATILASMGGGNLPIAEPISEPPPLPELKKEEPPPPDNPDEFNYFPYDLQLDTLAFMTCDNDNFFTFKAGSYFSRSGLRLSEYFLKQVGSKSASALQSLIKSSTKHQAIPQLSIAHRTHFISILEGGVAQFPVRLHREMSNLVSNGNTRVREINGNPITAEFSYHEGIPTFNHHSDKLNLVLSYKAGKHTLHQTGGEDGVDIYGRVYRYSLAEVVPGRYVLNTIEETKYPQNIAQTDWKCPPSLRFEIRRNSKNGYIAQKAYDELSKNSLYKEKYPTLGSAMGATDPSHRVEPDEATCEDSSAGSAVLNVVRKVLGNNWNINETKKCISLKSPSVLCHSALKKTQPIVGRLKVNDYNCDQTTNNYCPHYFSMCVRKN